ncbi:uncharacterized protein LOC114302124 [Camellia sinensis]|uniref:uncharacterized protein LOC114302124 n=1 Tax=Camellia sinensis TaxID=4442 RepID=UPI0010362DA6|nr:uncharacterized protein LOC114302124 [Camellia sinensis]
MEELQTYGSSNSSKNIFDDTKISAEEVFDSKDELLTWVCDIGRANGFVIVIRTSDYGGGTKRPRIYLACERSAKYRSCKKLKDGSKDLLRQTAAKHLQGHSYVGRLSTNEKSLLVDMSKSLKAGRSQMQQLLGELAKHKYIEHHRCEEGSMTVTDLFWAHPVSLDLLRTFPRVLIMDYTYKTNRYRLPLLEIVGVTSTHMAFFVAIAYLQTEWVDNYEWRAPGNVSICALEYVLAKSKRENSVGIDVAACGCVLRHTHGLPCAHEIVDYMRQGRPIPLSSIHVHWTRLTICVHNPKVKKLELTCIPELEMILKQFNESDIAMKLDMLKKLREIANPASTFLIEPDVKPNPRRGHKKTDISCRRDPCAFEFVDDGHDNQSTLAPSQSQKKRASKVLDKKRNVKTKTYHTRTSLPSANAGDFPPMLIPFIKLMKDVDGDGNCDFRAIASLLGL